METTQPAGMDAHAHLDHPSFDADRAQVLAQARRAGVGAVLVVGADPAGWDRVRRVAAEHGLRFAVGVHPWWPDLAALSRLETALRGASALGEVGLDYARARDEAARRHQRHLLDAQLPVAHALGLPVVLHLVRAHGDLLAALRQQSVRAGMVHGFTRGDPDPWLAIGLSLSFGPDLLRSERVRDLAAQVPLDRLLLESDAPDRPLRGDRGLPEHVADLAAALAPRRGLTPAELLTLTGENARRLFAWPQA